MLNQLLLYLGAFLPLFWGVAHLFPTQSVVSGFGAISLDNRRIITMEWITEGVALIFLGALVAAVTLIDSQTQSGQALCSVWSEHRAVTASMQNGYCIQYSKNLL